MQEPPNWDYSLKFTQVAEDCGYLTVAWYQINIKGFVPETARFILAQSMEYTATKGDQTNA